MTNLAGANLPITDVKVRLVDTGTDGLIAWASCVVAHDIMLDNIAVRRSARDGALFLTYPTKRTDGGDKYPYFNPILSEASHAVEEAVRARLATLAKAAATAGRRPASERATGRNDDMVQIAAILATGH